MIEYPTLREVSAHLLDVAASVRADAAAIEVREPGLAARLRANAYDLELNARKAAVRAASAGEPE